MSEPAIQIRGLEKSFSGFTLGPLDLTVPGGAIYGLIGPNGVGKTTTIDLMLGMGRAAAGTIRIFGLDHVRDEVAIKRRLGYVSPDLNYQPWRTVGRVIRFHRGFYPEWDDEYCRRLLDTLQVGWREKIANLSFGAYQAGVDCRSLAPAPPAAARRTDGRTRRHLEAADLRGAPGRRAGRGPYGAHLVARAHRHPSGSPITSGS